MTILKFLRGTKDKFKSNPPEQKDGQLIFVDDGSIYMDKQSDGIIKRIQMGGKEALEKSYTLSLSGISIENQISITDNAFFQENNYSYIVSPLEANYDEYVNCGGRASSIKNNTITFSFKEKPTKDLTVNIIRFEVKSNV